MMLGLNFPHGPLQGLRRHGVQTILGVLTALGEAAPAHLKGRYLPPLSPSESA